MLCITCYLLNNTRFLHRNMVFYNIIYCILYLSRNDTAKIETDEDAEGIMFNGNGYILLPSTDFYITRPAISIAFRTYSANGLLYFMGKEVIISLFPSISPLP